MRRGFLLVCTAVIMLLNGGCWDHIPIEKVAFATAIGIDKPPNDPSAKNFVTTISVALPKFLAISSGDGASAQTDGTPFYLVSSEQSTLNDALSIALSHIPRRLQFNHVQALVFNEDAARAGVSEIVDWAVTEARIRPFVSMAVTTGSAQMLLDVQSSLEPMTSNALLAVEENFGRTMTAYEVPLLTFARQLISPREDPVAPVFERVDPQFVHVPPGYVQQPISGQPAPTGEALGQVTNPGNELRVVGMAVFKGDKLVGILRGRAARGAVWLKGQPLGTVSVPNPEFPDRTASVVVIRAHTDIQPKLVNGTLQTTIKIRVVGDALEIGTFQPFDYSRNIPSLESEMKRNVASDVEETLRFLTAYGSDILGLRELLFRTDPKGWRRVKSHWDNVYESSTTRVIVDAHIDRSGLSR